MKRIDSVIIIRTNCFSPYYFQKVGKLLDIPKLTLRHQISQRNDHVNANLHKSHSEFYCGEEERGERREAKHIVF